MNDCLLLLLASEETERITTSGKRGSTVIPQARLREYPDRLERRESVEWANLQNL